MSDSPSRYRECVVYRDGEVQFLGARPRLDTTPQPDDRFHVVTDGDRIDRLAYHYFGDATLWWLIADWNDIEFPLDLPPSGTTLRIASYARVMMDMLD